MKSWLKTILVAAMVGLLALATVAVAQTEEDDSDEGPRSAQERREALSERFDRRHASHRDGCGRHFGPKARRIVYNETKVQTEDGFAVIQLDVGEVTVVNGSSITIERGDGESVSATANDEAKVCYNGEEAALGDIQVGDKAALRRLTQGDETVLKAVKAGTPSDN